MEQPHHLPPRAFPQQPEQEEQAQQQPQQQQQQPPLQSPDLGPSPPSHSSTASSSRARKPTLSLDLSNLPPLSRPTPSSNTLIFTNLQSRDIFLPDNLQTIRSVIAQTAPIHAFSPLRSFGRIVVSFLDEAAAVAVRQVWDGEAILGDRCRVYFGQPTPLTAPRDHLALPDAGKLFFISPPPSPPHGWQARLEDAPNRMVHAEDLAEALARLRGHHNHHGDEGSSPVSPVESSSGGGGGGGGNAAGLGRQRQQRGRSSTLIFQPDLARGASPDLPCVTVDDMTEDEPGGDISPITEVAGKPGLRHTVRPPVELIHDA